MIMDDHAQYSQSAPFLFIPTSDHEPLSEEDPTFHVSNCPYSLSCIISDLSMHALCRILHPKRPCLADLLLPSNLSDALFSHQPRAMPLSSPTLPEPTLPADYPPKPKLAKGPYEAARLKQGEA